MYSKAFYHFGYDIYYSLSVWLWHFNASDGQDRFSVVPYLGIHLFGYAVLYYVMPYLYISGDCYTVLMLYDKLYHNMQHNILLIF